VRAVTDRFAQIDPAMPVAVDGYLYNGRPIDVRPVVDELRAIMPGLRATIVIPYLAVKTRRPTQTTRFWCGTTCSRSTPAQSSDKRSNDATPPTCP
jgi:acyl-coenzyme A synthetase/AMP-(fatty) acid ligase